MLTGVLRVAKEGIFSGFNNPEVYTVLDERYSEYLGLTPTEVQDLLGRFGASEKYDEVRSWYDGYVFGGAEVYNPWSVLKYVKSGCAPDAYWVNTSENSALGEIVAKAGPDTLDRVRGLVEGDSVTSTIDVGTVYPRIADDATSVWSYLLMAGYLKASGRSFVARRWRYRLEVPNEEVRQVYEDEALRAFPRAMPTSVTNPVVAALVDGDADALCDAFSRLLECASVRDLWGEAFYQGFVLALVALVDGFGYKVDSNRESGNGYFDIQLDPLGTNHPGIVIELKALANEPAGPDDLRRSAEAALAQIADRDHTRELRRGGACPVLCYGVAFRGRDVAVAYGDEACGP